MAHQLFVNLPVKDLARTRAFFTQLGYGFNPQFSNDSGACMVINDSTQVMLLAEPFFQTFTKKKLADAREVTEVLVALGVESRAAVDALVDKAMASGAGEANPAQDHGFMYGRSFQDLDGHIWEVFWMDVSQMPANS